MSKDTTLNDRLKSPNYKKEVIQWIVSVIISIIAALFLRAYVFEQVQVVGPSMETTLSTGQRLFLYKLGYHFAPPQKNDIIVLQYQKGNSRFPLIPASDEVDFVKRIIGVPGDEVDIRNDGGVYINGTKLKEPYANGRTAKKSVKLPLKVPPNSVFVLGDNREVSMDSREIGIVNYDMIKGKALWRIWPLKEVGTLGMSK